ncbi:MAG: hypothetical protein ACTSYB_14945, partial [Candidatus Helarchaeota archaeon]
YCTLSKAHKKLLTISLFKHIVKLAYSQYHAVRESSFYALDFQEFLTRNHPYIYNFVAARIWSDERGEIDHGRKICRENACISEF